MTPEEKRQLFEGVKNYLASGDSVLETIETLMEHGLPKAQAIRMVKKAIREIDWDYFVRRER